MTWNIRHEIGADDMEKRVVPATNAVKEGKALYVVYIAGATAASTGLPTQPAPGLPWIMYPGTPKAHIMFVPEM